MTSEEKEILLKEIPKYIREHCYSDREGFYMGMILVLLLLMSLSLAVLRSVKSRKVEKTASGYGPLCASKTSTDKKRDWRYVERWEDYPAPNYDAEHTYCLVELGSGGNAYYYRTRNPELRVGDKVCVPVGHRYEDAVGRIISMENYIGWSAPYPLEKTKYIKKKME